MRLVDDPLDELRHGIRGKGVVLVLDSDTIAGMTGTVEGGSPGVGYRVRFDADQCQELLDLLEPGDDES